jgi:hypothetical protein
MSFRAYNHTHTFNKLCKEAMEAYMGHVHRPCCPSTAPRRDDSSADLLIAIMRLILDKASVYEASMQRRGTPHTLETDDWDRVEFGDYSGMSVTHR